MEQTVQSQVLAMEQSVQMHGQHHSRLHEKTAQMHEKTAQMHDQTQQRLTDFDDEEADNKMRISDLQKELRMESELRSSGNSQLSAGLEQLRSLVAQALSVGCITVPSASVEVLPEASFDTATKDKDPEVFIERWGFERGGVVKWTGSDDEIPKGSSGTVVGFTDDRVRVQFTNNTFSFKASELMKVPSPGSPLMVCSPVRTTTIFPLAASPTATTAVVPIGSLTQSMLVGPRR
jgi:hypothetical protein